MKPPRVAPFLAVLFSALCMPDRGDAYCRNRTTPQRSRVECETEGEFLGWPGGCAALSIDPRDVPVEVGVDGFRRVVRESADRWSAADCGGGAHPSFRLVDYPDCTAGDGYRREGSNANVVRFLREWNFDEFHIDDAIAVTITRYAVPSGALRDADTHLRSRSGLDPGGYLFSTNGAIEGTIDLRRVLVHEFGHTQGIGHSDVENTVMRWNNAGLFELTADDQAAICAAYPPDRGVACDPEPRGGFVCATPCQCGAAPGATEHAPHAPLVATALATLLAVLLRRRAPA